MILLCVGEVPSHRCDALGAGVIKVPVIERQGGVKITIIVLHLALVEKHGLFTAGCALDDCTYAVSLLLVLDYLLSGSHL